MKVIRLLQGISVYNLRQIPLSCACFNFVEENIFLYYKFSLSNFYYKRGNNKKGNIDFKMPYYAVAKGKSTGIFNTWSECQEQIIGFKGAVYKKFLTPDEAEVFIKERNSNTIDKRKTQDVKESMQPEEELYSNKLTIKEGSESPTLRRMRKEMKNLQKDISCLRDKFEIYTTSKATSSSQISGLKRKNEIATIEVNQKKTKLIEAQSGNGKFTVDDDGYLILYTDGACHFNGQKGAQAGIGVYFGPDHPMNVSEPVNGRATNNTAEIQAATFAAELTKAAGFDKVVINTDSQFMINCMTSWLGNWKKNNWKKRDGSPVINKEDLVDLDTATEGLLIRWNHVKAHSGIEGNEAADQLASEGAKKYVAK